MLNACRWHGAFQIQHSSFDVFYLRFGQHDSSDPHAIVYGLAVTLIGDRVESPESPPARRSPSPARPSLDAFPFFAVSTVAHDSAIRHSCVCFSSHITMRSPHKVLDTHLNP